MSYIESLLAVVNKDEFKSIYLDKLTPLPEVAIHFNITQNGVIKLAEYWNMKRYGGDVVRACRLREKEQRSIDLHNKITKEVLKKYYIDEDHEYYESIDHFNLSEENFMKLLNDYGLKKDRRVSGKRGVQTKIRKAGSAEAYYSKAAEVSRKTKIAKYGSLENYNKIVKQHTIESNLKKYNTKWRATYDLTVKHNALYAKVWGSEEESVKFLKSFKQKPTREQLQKQLNCNANCCSLWIERYRLQRYVKDQATHYNDEIAKYIHSIIPEVKIEMNNRVILNGLEIDIYLPEYKFGIEFNGNYWHSTVTGTPRDYHFNKSKLAVEKGIRLIHVYQYEWDNLTTREIIKSLIKISLGKADRVIYARNCEIKEITNKEARVLNDKNHLQGHRNAHLTYGLYYKGELVQLMSFSKNKKYEWEIIRGCPGSNNIVVGGVSKLFKHFIEEHNPKEVFSYCDFNKFDGKSYEALGMKFIGYTGPDMKWLLSNGSVVNRNPSKHKELAKNSLAQIYGAGSKKYLWSK